MQSLSKQAVRSFMLGSLALAATLSPLEAQAPHTENTLTLDGSSSPPATIADVTWLEGHWRGEGAGGVAEEVWLAPSGGAMPGVFRVVQDDEVLFYEILTLVEHEETLELRLKHFNADLTGWEEKDEIVTFPLVRVGSDVVHFDGLTFLREGDDGLRAFVAVRQNDGSLQELSFLFSRVR